MGIISYSILCALLNNIYMYIPLIIGIFFIFFKKLVEESRRSIVYFEIIFIILILQMLVFPLIGVDNLLNPIRYLFLVISGFYFFFIGCSLNRKKINVSHQDLKLFFSEKRNKRIIFFTSIAGLCILLGTMSVQNSLITTLDSIIGFGIASSVALLFVDSKKYIWILLTYITLILVGSIQNAVFAPFIAIGLLLFSYLGVLFDLNKIKFICLILFSLLMLSFIQNVKLSYREMVWFGDTREFSYQKFIEAMFVKRSDDSSSAFERAGNGSIISQIYEYIPDNYPHKYGEKLVSDLSNSLLPRLIFTEKKVLDNTESYTKYTGNSISENTSVGINVFGISYAEFGILGSFIFLFFFGLMLCLVNNIFYYFFINKGNYIVLILMPVIFSHFFKFEQEFFAQFTGWVKVLLICGVYILITKSTFNDKVISK